MNSGQESKLPGNSNRFPVGDAAGSDEDYEDVEDVGSGVEDDAPESFQALNRPEPPWVTFPDLLRVPTSTANNAATEDDSPESLSFAAAQSFRSNDLTNPSTSSGFRSLTANPLNLSCSSTNSHVPFVGGISKNRLSHPDVSHVGQSNLVSASSRSYHNSNCSSSSRQGPGQGQGPESSAFTDPSGVSSSSTSTSSRPLPALPVNPQSYNSSGRLNHQPGSSDNDYCNRIANHPHRSPINSLNLSSALYSSPHSSSIPPSLAQSLAPITNALTRVQSSVDALSRQVNERLDALENRLNNLTASSSSATSNGNCTVNSSDYVINHNRLRDMSPESLKSFINEQKREMHNERRAFLLSFAEALRNAAESSNRSSSSSSSEPSSSSKLNGL